MKLLEIQSSVRQEGSISRILSDEFIQAWKTTHSKIQHKRRDVGINPPAHPTGLWTKANYMPPEERSPEMVEILATSEALIEELLWADYILLGDLVDRQSSVEQQGHSAGQQFSFSGATSFFAPLLDRSLFSSLISRRNRLNSLCRAFPSVDICTLCDLN